MSILETIAKAKAYLETQGRVSLRVLRREFELDDEALEELVEELVDVQQVAAREGKVLSWMGSAPAEATPKDPSADATAAALAEPAAVPDAPDAERRQLTVMFCDLVDSTELSQRLDAEDLRNVVRAYQEAAASVIERYEGHVAQYLGDGMVAYFGYPQAHEDDAERAVRAGLEILTALAALNDRLEPEYGLRLAVRVGMATGPVVVGQMGGGAKSETLALGDTTNIAARLEGVAEPDSVVISGATLRLVPGLFVTKDLGTPPLKGITEPLRVYRVLQATGVRSRLDVDPSRLTPLVGRDQEVGLLLERWEQIQEGEGQTVLISGEPGLGKSRLARVLRDRIADQPHTWLECRCSTYTQHTALHPILELLQQGLGFQADDSATERLTRLEQGLEFVGLDAPETFALLAMLLSLPVEEAAELAGLSPEARRKKALHALVGWTLALGEQQPVVVLVEDLHWCDPSSLELLGILIEQIPTARVLTVLTHRPEFASPWPAGSQLTPVSLGRLRRRQVAEMVGKLAAGGRLPDAVTEQIVARADGVPLYVEELTKMVLESGLLRARDGGYELSGTLSSQAIPATLEDSLMARLDRLTDAKEVAQLAAVLGREFSYELLAAVSPMDEPALHRGLERLVGAELVFQRGDPPRASYTFKHALVQDAAYQSLLAKTRRGAHGRILGVLQERFPERVESEPELAARHAEAAGLAEEAIDHYARAGRTAAARSAHREAVVHFRRAVSLLDATLPAAERDARECSLQLALAPSLLAIEGYAHPETGAAWERARSLCKTLGDSANHMTALSGLAVFHQVRSELEPASRIASHILETGRSAGDETAMLAGHSLLASVLYFQGQFEATRDNCEKAIALYGESHRPGLGLVFGTDLGVFATAYYAASLWALGKPDQALAAASQGVARAEASGHAFSLALSRFFKAIIHWLRGEPAAQASEARQAIELAATHDTRFWLGLSQATAAAAKASGSVDTETRSAVAAGLALTAESGQRIGGPQLTLLIAAPLVAAGDADALPTLEGAASLAAQFGQPYWDAEIHRLRGELCRGAGDVEAAHTLFQRALEVARSQRACGFELRSATSLARLLAATGGRDEARSLLAPVYDAFTEGFDTQDLKDAKALLEELS